MIFTASVLLLVTLSFLTVPCLGAAAKDSEVHQIETDDKGKAYVVTDDGARWVSNTRVRSLARHLGFHQFRLSAQYVYMDEDSGKPFFVDPDTNEAQVR